MAAREVVTRTSDGRVLRWGYMDFVAEGDFDGGTETIVTSDFVFSPPIEEQDWRWTGAIFVTDGSGTDTPILSGAAVQIETGVTVLDVGTLTDGGLFERSGTDVQDATVIDGGTF